LQDFDEEHRISHLIEAKRYFNLNNSPNLLLMPKVTVYNKNGAEAYTITSKYAQYLQLMCKHNLTKAYNYNNYV
jgi:hypothetical protein